MALLTVIFMGIMADVLVRGYVGWNLRLALLVLEPVFPKVHEYTDPTRRLHMRDNAFKDFSNSLYNELHI